MYATNFYTPYCLGRSERKKKKKKTPVKWVIFTRHKIFDPYSTLERVTGRVRLE